MDKRFNLVIPNALYEELEAEAVHKNITVTELIRKYMKFGLLSARLEKEGKLLSIRDGNVYIDLTIL